MSKKVNVSVQHVHGSKINVNVLKNVDLSEKRFTCIKNVQDIKKKKACPRVQKMVHGCKYIIRGSNKCLQVQKNSVY